MADVGAPARLTYREAIRRFTRNARLYLVYVSMSEINNTVYTVAFALYLAAVFVPEGQVHLLGVAMDPNVHIGEYKAATCDIRPGRRPRGPAVRSLVDAYRDG